MREKLWLAYLLFLSFFLNAFSATSAQERPLTARGVVQRIQEHVGIPWQKETVDTFKAGDPDTKVTGIAVTMMATFGVLQRAAARLRAIWGTLNGLHRFLVLSLATAILIATGILTSLSVSTDYVPLYPPLPIDEAAALENPKFGVHNSYAAGIVIGYSNARDAAATEIRFGVRYAGKSLTFVDRGTFAAHAQHHQYLFRWPGRGAP